MCFHFLGVQGELGLFGESLPALVAAGGGSIVNISSLAAWQREEWLTAIPGSVTRFAETHPADDAEAVAQLVQVLSALATSSEVPAP